MRRAQPRAERNPSACAAIGPRRGGGSRAGFFTKNSKNSDWPEGAAQWAGFHPSSGWFHRKDPDRPISWPIPYVRLQIEVAQGNQTKRFFCAHTNGFVQFLYKVRTILVHPCSFAQNCTQNHIK